MLSKTGQIEKALLDDMILKMEEQKGSLFSKEDIIHWLNLWYKAMK